MYAVQDVEWDSLYGARACSGAYTFFGHVNGHLL